MALMCRTNLLLAGNKGDVSIGSYEEFLAESEFIRVHRSHIVNVKHVKSCNSEGLMTMNDGTGIEVSRRRRTEVVNILRER